MSLGAIQNVAVRVSATRAELLNGVGPENDEPDDRATRIAKRRAEREARLAKL